MIKLTSRDDGHIMRVNPYHIVYYGPSLIYGSDVALSNQENGQCVRVKESAEEIDKLLLELP